MPPGIFLQNEYSEIESETILIWISIYHMHTYGTKYTCGVPPSLLQRPYYWNPVHDHKMALHGHKIAYHQGFNFNDWLVSYSKH